MWVVSWLLCFILSCYIGSYTTSSLKNKVDGLAKIWDHGITCQCIIGHRHNIMQRRFKHGIKQEGMLSIHARPTSLGSLNVLPIATHNGSVLYHALNTTFQQSYNMKWPMPDCGGTILSSFWKSSRTKTMPKPLKNSLESMESPRNAALSVNELLNVPIYFILQT